MITLDGSLGITTPGLTNTGTETIVNLTTTGNTILGNASTDTLNVGNGNLVTDASGNVGIGTASPVGDVTRYLNIVGAGGAGIFLNDSNQGSTATDGATLQAAGTNTYLYNREAGFMAFGTSNSEKMRIDSSGNVGLGVTPSAWWTGSKALQISGTTLEGRALLTQLWTNGYLNSAGTTELYIANGYSTKYRQDSGEHRWYTAPSGTAGNAITFTQAMTLDASGKLGVGTAPTYTGHFVNTTDAASASFGIMAQAATVTNQYGLYIELAGDPNNTTNYFFSFLGSSTTRAVLRANGGLANYSANNVNLSDERVKKDIVNAGSYLDKICAIPVRTFLYKDQTDTQLNLGVIAQEVEVVAPELVDVSGFGETPEDGIPLKAIYQTDLQYALMKCIQEQQALITSLTARLELLEAK
jgi:hypothetical protein